MVFISDLKKQNQWEFSPKREAYLFLTDSLNITNIRNCDVIGDIINWDFTCANLSPYDESSSDFIDTGDTKKSHGNLRWKHQ